MIATLIDEIQYKLSVHDCVPGCQCHRAVFLLETLIALKNIRAIDGYQELRKFIISPSPVAAPLNLKLDDRPPG